MMRAVRKERAQLLDFLTVCHTTNIIPDSAWAVLQNIDEAKLVQTASSNQITYSLTPTDKGCKLTVHKEHNRYNPVQSGSESALRILHPLD